MSILIVSFPKISRIDRSEVMRRIVSAGMAEEMIAFTKLAKYLEVT